MPEIGIYFLKIYQNEGKNVSDVKFLAILVIVAFCTGNYWKKVEVLDILCQNVKGTRSLKNAEKVPKKVR